MGARKRAVWHHLRGANQSTARDRRSPRALRPPATFAQPSGLQMTHLICLRYTLIRMDATELISEIIATYQRHGWELRRVLLRPETRAALAVELLNGAAIVEADFDALWFARSSHGGRESWALRLIAALRFALFAAFAAARSV